MYSLSSQCSKLLGRQNVNQILRALRQGSRSSKLKPGGSGIGVKKEFLLEDLPPAKSAKVLIRPFFFTIGFSGATFAACAIWQYENMRRESRFSHTFGRSQKSWWYRNTDTGDDIRKQINIFWNSLNDGQKVFAPILGFNVLVFAGWRIPGLRRFMARYFFSSPSSKSICIPMVLSTFSHVSFIHLAANMYVLHSFSDPIVKILGKEQFLGLYLSSGVVASLASLVHKVVTKRSGYSIGASGAICAVIGIFGTLVPHAQLQIILLPMLTFTASSAIKALIAMDTVGVIAGWKFLDHAAHLGGMLTGIWWCYFGNRLVWGNREPVMNLWHKYVRNSE